MIALQIDHPSYPSGEKIQGFDFFWARYVNGFNRKVHCQKCLIGKTSQKVNSVNVRSGVLYRMDESDRSPYLYVCGVANGFRSLGALRNFHLALRPQGGALACRTTYNGYTVSVTGAEALVIPPLPDDFEGLPRTHARCKNFQFGVEYF
jgi:hypothetical protein